MLELRDRIDQAARKVGYATDVTESGRAPPPPGRARTRRSQSRARRRPRPTSRPPPRATRTPRGAGSRSLGNVARAAGGLGLPNLERLGLGRCRSIAGLSPDVRPGAAHGVALPRSAGKDSTTGHWELCGIVLEQPFPTYPRGFPPEVLAELTRRTGRGVIGNRAASGTAIIAELGEAHQRSGNWIVSTSADSVFQVAAHEATVPLGELYEACAGAGDAGRAARGEPGDRPPVRGGAG